MKKTILGGSRVGKTLKLEPKDSPLMEVIRNSAQHGVRRSGSPKWLEDDLKPVDFGPYRIIGHHRDENGVHQLMIRDMVENIDIYLVGIEDERVQHNNTSV